MRAPATRNRPRIAKVATFPAPVSGWIKNQNLAQPDARAPDGSRLIGAEVLENWFPTATGVRMRAGTQTHSVVKDGEGDIVSLFTYANGNNRSMFAASATAIYDATLAGGPDYIEYAPGYYVGNDAGSPFLISDTSPVLDSFTSGDWVSVQFATVGGTFLRLVNGTDTPLVYDGAAFSTSPAITGVTAANLSFVWEHANRLWFVEKNTLNAWYLDVDAIGGAATKFPLGGVFARGGSLLFGAAWSIESGDGLAMHNAFFTTEGEVAVYRGSDPSDASTWSKVGVYRIGKPLGPKAFIRAGGDIVVATDIGLLPLSVAVQRDFAALSPSAVSYAIEDAWNSAVEARSSADWHCEVWPTKQMMVVALPTVSGSDPQTFIANARTGAWCLFTGWDAKCVAVFGDRFFFGSTDGRVIEAEATGADNRIPFTSVCVPLFDMLKAPSSRKVGLQARAVIRAPSELNERVSLQADYRVSLPASPDDTSTSFGNVWGTAVWGQSVWGATSASQTLQAWKSVSGSGYALSPALQITSGKETPPSVELVRVDLTFDEGDVGS